MDKLAESLGNYQHGEEEKLQKAAMDWMMYAMKTYNGKLRKRAIGITTAIIDFIDDIKGERE